MTVGQRIAQKRKEKGLSQEGLGEQLGVSRQAIYKWESDAALPEIEKLIALSRIYAVPVGWLLGVEENEAPRSEDNGGELTEEQLRMVREIVDGYLDARPPVEKEKKRRWPIALGVMAGIALLVVLISLFSRLNALGQQYTSLQNSIYGVTNSVNQQISAITGRVEEVLKGQNGLTAEYGTEILSTDLFENTVTFRVWATPKTYVEGMTVRFTADYGESFISITGAEQENRQFAGEITCPLTDRIDLSACFISGGEEQTQLLEDYYGLYTSSFPEVYLTWPLWFSVTEDTLEGMEDQCINIDTDPSAIIQSAEIVSLRVGLFRDQELVTWYTERETPINGGSQTETFYHREEAVALERGHIYCEAAVIVDQYGRTRVYQDCPIFFDEAQNAWSSVTNYESSAEATDWNF